MRAPKTVEGMIRQEITHRSMTLDQVNERLIEKYAEIKTTIAKVSPELEKPYHGGIPKNDQFAAITSLKIVCDEMSALITKYEMEFKKTHKRRWTPMEWETQGQ